MINELTLEQEKLMEKIVTDYENYVLGGNDSYNTDEIIKGINFIYKLSDMNEPEIVICESPKDMAIESELQPGETIDYLGNGYDSGWTAFYDFFKQIGIDYGDIEFEPWLNFIKKSGVFATVLCENVAFVCIRPCKASRNKNDDLHCEDGMAIAWRDGYGEYYLNGVSVDENIVMTPAEKLDINLVVTEKNAEVRREIIRKIGIERVCNKLNAKLIDKEGDYELLGLTLNDNRIRPYLKMINPSTGTYHIEGVAPEIKTVKEALAWRNQTEDKPIVLT